MEWHGVAMRYHSGVGDIVYIRCSFRFIALKTVDELISGVKPKQNVFFLQQHKLFLRNRYTGTGYKEQDQKISNACQVIAFIPD